MFPLYQPHKKPKNEAYSFRQVQERAGGPPPPNEDEELVGPPDYLQGKVENAIRDGPARLLLDGKWCGHGEATYWTYDIKKADCRNFSVRLSEPEGPPIVAASCQDTNEHFRFNLLKNAEG